jgi:DNA transposition AAA+ family ATPase
MINLTSSQFKRLQAFENCFIEYPEISEIYQILDHLRFNQSLGGEPESFLLTGETGVGKTALVNNYLSRFDSGNGWNKQTVLNTRIPSKVSEKNTLNQFLVDLGSKAGGRSARGRNEIAKAGGVVTQLKRKSVELIIVNEIQELVEFSSADDRQTIANTFKNISEEAGVSFVLVGMPYAEVIAEESQWSSRLSWRRNIDYFKLFEIKVNSKNTSKEISIDKEQKLHFARFVAGLVSRMGYETQPSLTKSELLYPLYAVCRGECRRLKHFLRDAMLESFIENKATIDLEVLANAFKRKFPYLDNPFTCSLDELKLHQIEISSMYNTKAIAAEDRILAPRFTDAIPLGMLLSKSSLKVS